MHQNLLSLLTSHHQMIPINLIKLFTVHSSVLSINQATSENFLKKLQSSDLNPGKLGLEACVLTSVLCCPLFIGVAVNYSSRLFKYNKRHLRRAWLSSSCGGQSVSLSQNSKRNSDYDFLSRGNGVNLDLKSARCINLS